MPSPNPDIPLPLFIPAGGPAPTLSRSFALALACANSDRLFRAAVYTLRRRCRRLVLGLSVTACAAAPEARLELPPVGREIMQVHSIVGVGHRGCWVG
jgi:hypothetical protein